MKKIIRLAALVPCFLLNISFGQERATTPEPSKDFLEYSEQKTWTPADGTLCVPEYSTGCSMGDGFTDFAVEEIENYGSGCANLNGTGWSQYLGMGPAILYPGVTHDFIMQTGYNDQFVTIWIDFNDDYNLDADEIILSDFELTDAGQFYTAPVTIPADATPGLHYMRARTNWLGSSNDPCQEYTYGEAEDYYVMIGTAELGAIEGYVTELDGGAPVEDALITLEGLITYTTTSGADGYYLLDYVFVGDYELSCFKQGYNIQNTFVTIEEDITLNQDFELTQPAIVVSPLTISMTLPQNGTSEEPGMIQNNGNGQLDWSATVQLAGEKSKGFLDLQFQYPVAQGGGEAGIETDGNFIYTTKWNGSDILKYDLEGNFIEVLDGPAGLRDLAYNGTYFYGSAGITLVYEMDIENEVIVSTFTAPTNVRAIAYNDDENVFYANNYSSPVVIFDQSGANLGGFDTGPVGENYYGFAYDKASPGGPYLWGYAQTGESMNEIIQIQLPSGTETGFTLDVTDKLAGPVFNVAGGLYTHPNLVFGKWTLGGLVQNEWMWGLELVDAQTWLWIEPNTGSLAPGNSEDLNIQFDAEGLDPGEYEAQIFFTSYPEVGNPVIEVTLIVTESLYFPCELSSSIECTDIELSWSVCPAGSPDADSFYVYRDDEFLGMAVDASFSDLFVDPDVLYDYKVTAFYNGLETSPSASLGIVAPMPGDLEPVNLQITIVGSDIELICDPPEGCLIPDAYNLYRDGELIATNSQGVFPVDWGNYEYYVTAVYYFGESGPSNTVIITSVDEAVDRLINVYPNPVNGMLNVEAGTMIEEMQLIDNQGLIRYHSAVNSAKYQINTTEFSPGVYSLKLVLDAKTIIRKVVIR